MTYSGEDRLARLWAPAVRAIRPTEQVLLQKAVRRAVSDDGYIEERAIAPGSVGVLVDFSSASHTASSSDIVNYTAYLATVIHLPEGVWRMKARGALTGALSGASNMNSQIMLNSSASGNFQIPISAGDRLATVFPSWSLDAVQGEVTLQLMFRPSAGTLTIEAGEWLYRAERIG